MAQIQLQIYERKRMQDYRYDEHCEQFTIAMAYVPWQHFDKMYDDFKIGSCRVFCNPLPLEEPPLLSSPAASIRWRNAYRY